MSQCSKASISAACGTGIAAVITAGLLLLAGCESPWMFRGPAADVVDSVGDEVSVDKRDVRYVGDYAGPWGLSFLKVEAVALVTNLNGTGSNPPPSPQRDLLASEMLSHDVRDPEDVLRQPSTALVFVRGYLPPAVEKGDRFDIFIRTPGRSDTTSLKGGFLMMSRLRPMEILGGDLHTGHVIARAKGPVLVDSAFDVSSDPALKTRGRVLGGGVSAQSRPLGLALRQEANVQMSALISRTINERFYTSRGGVKQQVATPKNDRVIELVVPRRYKHNLGRFIRVVRSLTLSETATDRLERTQVLQRQLLEPPTAAVAALRLEAIGEEATEPLRQGLQSSDPEVRFYAAEALAYLDVVEAAPVLADSCHQEPAFRWHALAALAAMDEVEAGVALSDLLHSTSAETRYGAFRALHARTPDDPLVRPVQLSSDYNYHAISTTGEPMIHFSRTRRPEIVLFGLDQKLSPNFLFVRNGWMIKRHSKDQIKVSHFTAKGDRHKTCPLLLDEVIRNLAELGASYVDLFDIVRTAKDDGHLDSRLVVDALAQPTRKFVRAEPSSGGNHDQSQPAASELPERRPKSPSPSLFAYPSREGDDRDQQLSPGKSNGDADWSTEEEKKDFFGTIQGWFR